MANEIRLSEDFKSGTLTPGNSLTNSGTTMVSSALAQVMAVDSTQHYPINLDPLGTGNGPERAWITAHTAASTGATIVRGREGTTGVAHTSTTAWTHGPSRADHIMRGTTAQRTALTGGLPFKGQFYWDYDLNAQLLYNGTAWVCLTPQIATVGGEEATTSTSYTDLSTPGPAVTVTTGTRALVTVNCWMHSSLSNGASYMSVAVSGAGTVAASDASAARGYGDGFAAYSMTSLVTVTAGINTFTAKYKDGSVVTSTFAGRWISVVGLP